MAREPPTGSPTTSALCLPFCPPLGAKTANRGPSQLPGTLSLTLGASRRKVPQVFPLGAVNYYRN